jgi:hypothetical protein
MGRSEPYPAVGMASIAMIDRIESCPKCEGYGIASAQGFLDRLRDLFNPRPCPMREGRGEVEQSVSAERLAAEVIGKARSRTR